MKTKCLCVTGEVLQSIVNISIDSEGMGLSYEAYSTDSSFSESIGVKFCPFCGESIKTLEERRILYREELEAEANKKKATEERKRQKFSKIAEEERQLRMEEIKATHNPGLYVFDGFDSKVEAYSRKDAKILFEQKFDIKISKRQSKFEIKCVREIMKK